jgi:UDP-N-acetylglucosamine--dolichyl-phosphate N-acetylglucosaminephosphotransferase
MEYLILISVIISFSLAFIVLPFWIKKCRSLGLLWEDMNKYGHPKNVASSGGIVVVMAFILSVFSYLALKTFIFGGTIHALEIFSLVSVILILGIVGLVDDLLDLRKYANGKLSVHGLSSRLRIVLALVATIPLIVINAGIHSVNLPLLGVVNFGIFYPLILIPLGVAGVATTYNFLAGFNGLESGQGILILGFLSFVAYVTGSPWLAVVGLCMVAALIAFYIFNKVPAKVFPGDILTYSVGALIAGMAILGNFEKIALVVFIPYLIEIVLKSRGGLKKYSFGTPQKDGTLRTPYKKIYGLEHIAIKILGRKATERKVTYLIHAFQILFILIAFSML